MGECGCERRRCVGWERGVDRPPLVAGRQCLKEAQAAFVLDPSSTQHFRTEPCGYRSISTKYWLCCWLNGHVELMLQRQHGFVIEAS